MTDHPHLARLIEAARPLPALPTAVVAPENRRWRARLRHAMQG